MAVTLEELQLKFKSEIASATSKDEAALARVDAAVRSSQKNLEGMQRAHAANAAAARAASREQVAAEAALAGANPGDRAARAAAAQRAQALAARAAAKEEAGAAKLSEAYKKHDALKGGAPELVALLKRKNAIQAEQVAAKAAAAEQAAAAKKRVEDAKALQKARDAASEAAHTSRIDASKAAMAGAAGAALAFSAALLAAGAAAVVFGFGAAGAARDARILADALTRSEALGAEFTAVVGQLASKVPMARGQIAELARELNLMRLGRRDMQAGLTAIAITTSAIGESAGNVIKGVVQSSAAMRRFSLGARDMWGEYAGLAGSGLNKADVLGALATTLGKSRGEVERRLKLGQITLKQGLNALEHAAQTRFGKTIEAQMLSANTQFQKAKEGLSGMFAGVDMGPALQGLKELLSIFDDSTVAGSVLKDLIGMGFGGLSQALGVLLPLGKEFFLGMLIGALEMYLAIRPIARQIRDWVEPFLTAENAALAGKVAIYGIAAAFGLVAIGAAAAAAAIMLPFAIALATVIAINSAVRAAWGWLVNDAAAAGSNLIDSFVDMLSSGVDRAMNAAKDLASKVAGAFKSALGIASPSKVFAAFGRYTVEGYAEGVEQEAGQAQGAVDDMSPAAPQGAGGGAVARFGGGTVVHITMGDVYFAGKKATEQERGGLVEFLQEQLQIATNAVGAGQPMGAT